MSSSLSFFPFPLILSMMTDVYYLPGSKGTRRRYHSLFATKNGLQSRLDPLDLQDVRLKSVTMFSRYCSITANLTPWYTLSRVKDTLVCEINGRHYQCFTRAMVRSHKHILKRHVDSRETAQHIGPVQSSNFSTPPHPALRTRFHGLTRRACEQ